MDPIAKTAFYCCGARAADARSAHPICGDVLAERFMDEQARAVFARFAGMKEANASNAARHRIIDDLLRERLATQPQLRIAIVGAGFDTRAFRLAGGTWLEFDQPAIIALKDSVLPVTHAANPLTRVPIDFAHESLADKLRPWAATMPAVVVMEGVSMYLGPDAWGATAQALRRMLPGHTLVCDLIDATFIRRYSHKLRQAIRELGGEFAPPLADPAGFVASLGYRPLEAQSIAGRAVDLGALSIPRWLLDSLLRSLRDGYRVHTFEALPLSA